MTSVRDFIQRQPVVAFYVLTFAVSWTIFLQVGGSDFIQGEEWEDNPVFVLAVMGMLTGPTIAGLLLTTLLTGRAGLHELLERLTRWRASVRWYAIAIFTTPLAATTTLLALSLASPAFLPPIFTEDGSPAALLLAMGIGTTTLLEELGWTGFATPRLRLHHSVFTTGLIMGVPWATWHLLQISWVGSTTSEDVPTALYLVLYFLFSVASLTAYRILILWVYDHTESLLVATLMHASYAGFTLQIDFVLPTLTGRDLLIQGWVFGAALWAVVAGVSLLDDARLFGKPSGNRPVAVGARGQAPGGA